MAYSVSAPNSPTRSKSSIFDFIPHPSTLKRTVSFEAPPPTTSKKTVSLAPPPPYEKRQSSLESALQDIKLCVENAIASRHLLGQTFENVTKLHCDFTNHALDRSAICSYPSSNYNLYSSFARSVLELDFPLTDDMQKTLQYRCSHLGLYTPLHVVENDAEADFLNELEDFESYCKFQSPPDENLLDTYVSGYFARMDNAYSYCFSSSDDSMLRDQFQYFRLASKVMSVAYTAFSVQTYFLVTQNLHIVRQHLSRSSCFGKTVNSEDHQTINQILEQLYTLLDTLVPVTPTEDNAYQILQQELNAMIQAHQRLYLFGTWLQA